MGGLQNLDRPIKIQAGDKPILMSQVRSLNQALQYLPLPVTTYHYNEIAIVNLLFMKILQVLSDLLSLDQVATPITNK